jgi:hypothetical protein
VASLFAKLFADHAFELAELECYKTLPVVDGDYIGVISFRRYINKLILRDPQEFSAF